MEPLKALQSSLDPGVVVLAGDGDLSRHLADFSGGAPSDVSLLAAAYPRTTAEVAAILKACQAAGVAVVPQGGLTGLAGGALPGPGSLVLSLERMRAVEEIDTAALTMTVQAGTPLERVQQAAAEANVFFPLDLGARGSAQIGGNTSTNAGGNRVLRYGMMRDLVLGLEVVLADGTVLTMLNKMLKNNAGFDLKQLFIGTEGTLGIVTRVVLRLFPKPLATCTAMCAADSYEKVLELLRMTRERVGQALSAFEVMWPEFYALGTTALSRQPPLEPGYALYVLIETQGSEPDTDDQRLQTLLGDALEGGVIRNAVIAHSIREASALWAVRDCPGQFRQIHWPIVSFDVSLPTSRIGAFAEAFRGRIAEFWPRCVPVLFGHIADGNLHMAVKLDANAGSESEIEAVTYALTGAWHGSISAEHGIGTHKRAYLHYSRSPAEIALMRTLKATLDPRNTLNPGKVI